jgi:hypothetical protein
MINSLPADANSFYDPSCLSHNNKLEWMGYTVRSAKWRFTEWLQWNGTGLCPIMPLVNDSAAVADGPHAAVEAAATGLAPGMVAGANWTVLQNTDWAHNCQPVKKPFKKAPSVLACADLCKAMPNCAAVSWNAEKDHVCNFKCSIAGRRMLRGEQGVIVRPQADFCSQPPPVPPYAQRIELYDHRQDTSVMDLDAAEYLNVQASNPDIVKEMREVLRKQIASC